MQEKRKPDNVATGEQLQRLRLKAGLSQEELAEQLACSVRTIQRYEAGDTMPDLPTLRRMLACFHCEAADFFPSLSPSDNKNGGVA